MSTQKLPPDVCRSCGRPDWKHWVSCKANRCARCHRAPATPGLGLCAPCWLALQKERKRIVAEKLKQLAPEDDDEGL